MTSPKLTEDELTRLRILVSYEIYQVLRNHQVDDVGRTCIDLAERAVKAFAEWAPGDEAEEASTQEVIEWVLQEGGYYRAKTRYGHFSLRFTHAYDVDGLWPPREEDGLWVLYEENGDFLRGFQTHIFPDVETQANGWIERKYGKG